MRPLRITRLPNETAARRCKRLPGPLIYQEVSSTMLLLKSNTSRFPDMRRPGDNAALAHNSACSKSRANREGTDRATRFPYARGRGRVPGDTESGAEGKGGPSV